MLTPDEHTLMDVLADVYNRFVYIAGNSVTRHADLAEVSLHVHNLQHIVMAQSAARAHPNLYRLFGDDFGVTAPPANVAEAYARDMPHVHDWDEHELKDGYNHLYKVYRRCRTCDVQEDIQVESHEIPNDRDSAGKKFIMPNNVQLSINLEPNEVITEIRTHTPGDDPTRICCHIGQEPKHIGPIVTIRSPIFGDVLEQYCSKCATRI